MMMLPGDWPVATITVAVAASMPTEEKELPRLQKRLSRC